MLKEASIVVPMADNAGEYRRPAHRNLAGGLAAFFGGYTCTSGVGGWRDGYDSQHEPVKIYTVAMEDNAYNRGAFLAFAKIAWKALSQKVGYIRYPDGSVEFVDMADVPDIAAPVPRLNYGGPGLDTSDLEAQRHARKVAARAAAFERAGRKIEEAA